jgi:exopolysaccharide biosynthesis polyprenyl glycosylphosphotransferase
MSIPTHTNRTLLLIAVDVSLTWLALFVASGLRLLLPYGKGMDEPGAQLNVAVYLLTGVIWISVFMQLNMYTRRWSRLRDEWWALLIAVSTALLILAGGLYISFRQVSRLQFVYFGVIDLAMLTGIRVIHSWWQSRSSTLGQWRVLVVGTGSNGRTIAERLVLQCITGVQVVGFLDDDPNNLGKLIDGLKILGTLEEVQSVIQTEHISEVILALPYDTHRRVLSLISALEQLPVQVSFVPDVLDVAWFGTHVDDLGGVPLLRLRESPLHGPVRLIKRLIDISVSAALLVVIQPLMVVVALLIRMDSPGPAIIRQKRIGENAQPFNMLKFRTMYVDAETNVRVSVDGKKDTEIIAQHTKARTQTLASRVVHKWPNDPRVTRIGRTLRHYSIDELPQLVNVLRGEMSLVGPRPELPWLVDNYEPWQRHRFAVPPGMTGWWQINGRSDRPMHLNVEDDLYYIRNYSLWFDVVILLRTIPAVLHGKGAY